MVSVFLIALAADTCIVLLVQSYQDKMGMVRKIRYLVTELFIHKELNLSSLFNTWSNFCLSLAHTQFSHVTSCSRVERITTIYGHRLKHR